MQIKFKTEAPTEGEAVDFILSQPHPSEWVNILDGYILQMRRPHRKADVVLPASHSILGPLLTLYSQDVNQSRYIALLASIRDALDVMQHSDYSNMQAAYRKIFTRYVQSSRRPRIAALVRLIAKKHAVTTNTVVTEKMVAVVTEALKQARIRAVDAARGAEDFDRAQVGAQLDAFIDRALERGEVALDVDEAVSQQWELRAVAAGKEST